MLPLITAEQSLLTEHMTALCQTREVLVRQGVQRGFSVIEAWRNITDETQIASSAHPQ